MWRIANRRRPEGTFKIPVTTKEIFEYSAEWFQEKSRGTRTNLKQADPAEFLPIKPLADLFQQCKKKVEEEQNTINLDPVTTEQIHKLKDHPDCMIQLAKVTKLKKPTIFNRYAMVLAGYLAGKPEAIDLFKDFINYNFHDSDHYNTPEARTTHIQSLVRYFQSSEYAFGCEYVRTLKPLDPKCHKCPLYQVAHEGPIHTDITLPEIRKMYQEYMKIRDDDLKMVDVTIAAAYSIQYPDDPVWMFIVAPPSSAKTELINSVSELPHIYEISEYTPKTMASGKHGKTALLENIKPVTTLLFKDFTTILEMRHEDKGTIFGQLRDIYDGKYNKPTGSGKVINWKGRLGILGAVTEIIDVQYKISSLLGERFLYYRLEEQDPIDAAHMAFRMSGKEKPIREKIKQAVKEYVASLNIETTIDFSDDYEEEIIQLAIFAVRTRAGVIRDWKRQIEMILHPEAPMRITKQMKCLAKALALIQKKTSVDESIMNIIRKVAFDSISTLKSRIVIELCKSNPLTTIQLAEAVGYPPNTVKEAGHELVGHGILFCELTDHEINQSKPYLWSLGYWGEQFKEHLFSKFDDQQDLPF